MARGTLSLQSQSTLEYAVLLVCIILGLLAMQRYTQRAMQGRLKGNSDELGMQYDAAKESWDLQTYHYAKTQETTEPDGSSRSRLLEDEKTNRWSTVFSNP